MRNYFPKSTQRRQEMRYQIVVPANLKNEILLKMHDDILSGHLGVEKTFEKIRNIFWWPRLWNDVEVWVSSCMDCQSKKRPTKLPKAALQPIRVTQPFEIVGVDIIGPLKETERKNKYIVVFTDHFTNILKP